MGTALKTVTKISVLFAMCVIPVLAEDVTFSTVGLFCAGSGPCVGGSTDLQIGNYPNETYLAQDPVSTTVPVNTANVPLVLFDISDIGGVPRTGSGAFTLTIMQTAPTAGSASLTAALSGNYAVGSNEATFTFTQNSVMIGGILYTLESPTYVLPTIFPPTRADAVLADITAAPEPSFFAATGLGLLAFGFVAIRRRRTV